MLSCDWVEVAGAGPPRKRRQSAGGTVLNTCMMLVEPQASSPIVISPVPVAAILGACVFAIDTYPSTSVVLFREL